MSKKSNQEKIAEQNGNEVVVMIKEVKPQKVRTEPTDEEKEEKLRLKRAKDAERKRREYAKKKEERLAKGEKLVCSPAELERKALYQRQKYEADEEFRKKKIEYSREYYQKVKAEKPKEPKTTVPKKIGRPRKYEKREAVSEI